MSDISTPATPLQRAPEDNELLPTDYFRRFERAEIFPDSAPLEVDLGSGDGSFLLAMAQRFPERRFLGVERLLGRVRKLCRGSHRDGLTNLKVLRLESIYTVEWLLPPQSISRIHLLFPDPWPKARHHKRRVVQAPFLNAVTNALVPGGELLFRTDHEEYAEWALEQLQGFDKLELVDWLPADEFYAETDFQRQWAAAGRHKVHSLRAVTAS
ncbi:MAG: tRNA (guanosine(46)-N7)-methyltransferase TrmB [Akkermansiaceae bacterium]|nr:tRNA (guanosine(46)-N7)-methyltransferase TrmB [Akkermansiaceae bacterium]